MNTIEFKMHQIQELARCDPDNHALYQRYEHLRESATALLVTLPQEQRTILEAYFAATDAIHTEALKTACIRLAAQERKWSGYLQF